MDGQTVLRPGQSECEMVAAGRKALFQPIGSRRKGRGKTRQHSKQTHAANSVRLVGE